ncbi:peptide ABC transporter substrate-binding protein [Acetanaerobacterium elongatum]|uniref:Peptide/nickel transport system substrate-binding protein/oligopeptide transport system substrate-binding protein n=1 Tax=Acetanaerobacterium elongatum TaxID=258515 RepID=A0A1H0BXN3_9FIRM|nr:peptide ABC transporter substrate-binding protein [Acetanaerobacterium elongatum]SDN50428.1 peptide/nickel transport system substrate-binding protein/oligopeptide transport system substrate-binding protein [Acetanaerobacterium elongatum]
MKRKIAFLLSLTMIFALVLTACGSNATPSASSAATGASSAAPSVSNTAAGKQLVAQLGPNPETIDPALNSSVDGGNMLLFAYDCLLGIDKGEKIIPGAAEKWETSADGLTWTFHLRKGLKWSDGSPLTAKDFVYSWKRVADPKTAAPYGETVLGMVKGFAEAAGGNPDALAVSAPDDSTFVVVLDHPCSYFDKLAAFQTLSPVNQATIEKNGDAWATKPETYICNGPFYIKEWVPSSYILFAKNPNYWDAASIKLDSIKLLLIEDSNAAYAAYKTGEAMMIKYVPAAEIPSLKGNPEFHVDPSLSVSYISLNDTLKQFSDPRVRQALSLAIDRKYLAETLLNGIHTPATGIVCTGITDWDGSSFPANANGGKGYIDSSDPAANLEQAKKLLAEAGYPDGKNFPAITYSTNDAGYNKTVAEYLQQAWQKLGITVKVDIVEWATFTPLRRAGDYISSRNGWGFDYNDPSNILDLFMTTNGNNDGKYTSADYDAMMKKAAAETDPKTRFGYLHQAEDILMKDMGCIPLTNKEEFYLQSPKITGSWYSPRSYWYFQYADVTE